MDSSNNIKKASTCSSENNYFSKIITKKEQLD